MTRRDPLADAQAALREYAISPARPRTTRGGDRHQDQRKVFVFLSRPPEKLNVTTKLPISGPSALKQPFAQATGYGLASTVGSRRRSPMVNRFPSICYAIDR